MNLLHITDLHNNASVMRWLLEIAPTVDAILITGDFLDDREYSPAIDEQIDQFKCWFKDLSKQTRVGVCSGNHDLADTGWLKELDIWLKDGAIVDLNGLKFGSIAYGCEEYHCYTDCNVILHHEPPAKLKVSIQNGNDFGSKPLLAALKTGELKPDWIMSGHIHFPMQHLSRFRSTKISNPGTSNRKDNKPSYHMISYKVCV